MEKMSFEEFLAFAYRENPTDIVGQFAQMHLVGEAGLAWPNPVTTLEQLLNYVTNQHGKNANAVMFAARVAWNDYQIKLGETNA